MGNPNFNPIHELLGLIPLAGWRQVSINGEQFELCAASKEYTEAMYRKNPGHGVGNPGFSIHWGQKDGKTQLGNYLHSNRPQKKGFTRDLAEALVDAARAELGES